MDRNLFLPLSWKELKWWVNTAKRLVNDVAGGATLCGTKRGDQGGEASRRSNFPTF
jgi:hypothetical protein